MALPVVTAKQYDYGQYSSPTPVKYKGGQEVIGAAIGGALKEGVQSYIQTKQEVKKSYNWKDDTKLKLLEQLDPKTLAQNEMEIKALAEDIGELGRLKQLNKVSGDEYTERMVNLNNTFKSYLMLGKEIFQSAADGEIDVTKLKGENLDRNIGFNRAVSSGNLKTKYDKSTGKSTATWVGASGQEYSADLNDIVFGAKDYLKLEQKFDFTDLDNQDILQKIANQVDKKAVKMYMTKVAETPAGKFETLDQDAAAVGIAQSSYIDGFVSKYGKDVFEDVIKPTIEASTGKPIGFDYQSEEGQKAIRLIVSNQVASKLEQVGDRFSDETRGGQTKEPKHPSGYKLEDRKLILDNVSKLSKSKWDDAEGKYTLDSPFFQIRIKGPNDPAPTTYKFRRLEDGYTYYTKEGQANPTRISEESLYAMLDLREEYSEMMQNRNSGLFPFENQPVRTMGPVLELVNKLK